MSLILRFDKGTLLLSGIDISSKVPPHILQMFVWDDRVRCFRSCASNFKQIMEECRVSQVQVLDRTFDSNFPSAIISSVSLRPYQEVALSNWKLAEHTGIVCLPTGAGKTRIALAAIASVKVNTLCVVPTRVLLEQWQTALREFYDGPIGIIGDRKYDLRSLTVATFESAYRKMAWIGNRFQLLIVDECHHFGANFRDELLLMSAAPMRLGLTATKPNDQLQVERLSALIGPIVHKVGIGELVGSYLAPFDLCHVSIRLSPVEKLRYQRERAVFSSYFKIFSSRYPQSKWKDFVFFAQKSLQGKKALAAFFRTKRMISLTEGKLSAVQNILARHSGEKIILFTMDTQAAYDLSRRFLIMPITADIKRKEREWALTKFKCGEIKTLVSCKVLNEGVDGPDAAIAVIVGGSAVEREYIQRIGRILRPCPGKRAVVYELVTEETHEEKHASLRQNGLNSKTEKMQSLH